MKGTVLNPVWRDVKDLGREEVVWIESWAPPQSKKEVNLRSSWPWNWVDWVGLGSEELLKTSS